MANIMIVDDSPIFRRSLREIFETNGHRVAKEAEDGYEAIEAYNRDEIDLITMDIQLPGIDGIETVRRIRERNPEAVIVMISSLEQRNKVYDAIKLGAKHYITKPFTPEKVAEVVNTVLKLEPVRPKAPTVESDVEQQKEQLSRFVQKRELLKLETPSVSAVPFELVIKEGRPELTIHRHISDGNVRYLQSCLQGLLYYRKAKFVLVMEEPVMHDEGMRLIFDFVSAVRDRNGTVALVSEDLGYYTMLKAKFRHGVYRSCAEIGWS